MTVTELPVEPVAPQAGASAPEPRKKFSLLKIIGPGVVTGASDDDPSGIGTYSQAGAQLGFSISWTMVLTFPLMVAIQEISARVGRTTGKGIAGNIREHYPAWLLQILVAMLFGANVINIGADLSAMARCTEAPHWRLRTPIRDPVRDCLRRGTDLPRLQTIRPRPEVVMPQPLCLSSGSCNRQGSLGRSAQGLVVPTLTWNTDYFTTLVAIAGTTISPYLFFWQAAQEAEDVRVKPERQALLTRGWQAATAFARIRADTAVGMGFSNLIAVAIIMTTAATLYAHGMTNIQSSSQAAEALRPIAGSFAAIIFTAGIVGTGLLAVPALAGSAAYAVSEAAGWPVGLARLPRNAIAFYSTLALSMLIGIGLNFTPINPISALYWSAVVNGVAAVPIMVLLMIMTARRRVMGEFTIGHGLKILGWAATVAMVACVVGMVVTALV